MIASAIVPDLPAAVRPADLIPGQPADVELLAGELRRFAEGAAEAADVLRDLALGGWQGQAAAAFAHELGEAPKRLDRATEAFASAARVLRAHADVLVRAQERAARAIRLWQDGQARSSAAAAAADPLSDVVLPDPGAESRALAERLVLDARADVAASEAAVVAALDAASDAAPDEPGFLSSLVDGLASFGKGAFEATVGLGEFVYKLTPTYLVTDPQGYLNNLEMLGKGLLYGVQNPKEFGKALLDFQTWKEDPARALGHLVPDLLLALATAGAGSAARGVRGARALREAERTADAIRTTAALLPDAGRVAWRGEGLGGKGLTLTHRQNIVAEAFAGAAAKAEQSISPRIRHLMESHGAEPAGWKDRLKEPDSLKRKLATELGDDPELELDPVEAMLGISDTVRYTAAFDEAGFADGAARMAESLKAQGFEELKFRNTFGEAGYQGINTNWRDPQTGHVFELQFHTPASFDAKTVTHRMYEEMRLPSTSPERAAELQRLQDEIFDAVPRPPGAAGVGSPSGLPTLDPRAGLAGAAAAQPVAATDSLAQRASGEEP